MVDAAETAREELIHVLADNDDEFAEHWLRGRGDRRGRSAEAADQGGRPARRDRQQDHRRDLRHLVQEQGRAADAGRGHRLPAVPAGRSRRSRASSPATRSSSSGTPSNDEPLAMLAFKIAADPHLGKLTYIRVYSGVLKAGQQVLNSTKGRKERIGKIYQMHANKRQEIDEIGAGMIIAVMGLKDTTTGETLCDPAQPGRAGVDGLPGTRSSSRPSSRRRSPTRRSSASPSSGWPRRTRPSASTPTRRPARRSSPAWASCTSRCMIDRMKREFKVEANIGKPQVAYRETLRRAGGEGRVHPQEAVGWFRPVRQGHHRARADRTPAPATSSSTPSPVVASPRSTSRRSTTASRRPWPSARWPATRSRTSR